MSTFTDNYLLETIINDDYNVYKENRITPKEVTRSFDRLLSQEKPIPTLFCELVNKLGKWFSISNAVLALCSHPNQTLKVASWWESHCFKEGVLMSLPAQESLLYEVLRSGHFLHIQVGGKIPGNYIEQRLMYSQTTESLAVCPLIHNDDAYGVISLSSPVSNAFELWHDCQFNSVLEKMASVIAGRNLNEFRQISL